MDTRSRARRAKSMRACIAAAAILATTAGSCDRTTDVPSVVVDTTDPWLTGADDRVFVAQLELPEGAVVDDVQVRYTRHFWPGSDLANVAPAQQVGDSSEWRAEAPSLLNGSPDADHLFYHWVVEYTDNSTAKTARSAGNGRHDFVIGCTEAQTESTLATIASLAGTINDNYLLNPTYNGPAHFLPISLLNQGVPFTRADQLLPGLTVDVGKPALALFHPSPQESDESDDEYLIRITDMWPDPGSRLAGVGYGVTAVSATRRPTMGCLPSSRWFMHEAGIHTSDGLLTLYPFVDESTPGAQVISGLQTPADWTDPPFGQWHPRIWDVHFWFVDGEVVEGEDHPDGIPGASLPDGSFFVAETFE